MAQRSVEEVFRTIAPSRRRGIPNPPTIAEGVSGDNGDLASSLSQAGQEIAQLRTSYQQQVDLITANTKALETNTSSQGSHSAASTVGNVASSLLGGALGFLSPIISGLTHLFGGGSSTNTTLPLYTPPPPVSISGILHADTSASVQPGGSAAAGGNATPGIPAASTNTAANSLQTGATDSEAAIDHSSDTANLSGLMQLFAANGGSSGAPSALPLYTPPAIYEQPPPVSIGGSLQVDRPSVAQPSGNGGNEQGDNPGAASSPACAPQITVQVNAMDSQSFMDRSADIANAVREAMLNNHPINSVVADL